MAVATKSGIYNGYKVIGTQTLGLRGLVLWLKFNEGSGNIAYDSSFYNNHGTIYGATWTDGKFGKALGFDGVDDYVDCGNDESLNITDEITIVAWVKPVSFSTYNFIAKKYEAYTILFYKSKLRFDIKDGGQWRWDTSNDYAPPGGFQLGQWYFVAGTYDGSVIKLYLNGDYVAHTDYTGDIDATAKNLYIGANTTTPPTHFFDGLIDEVRIYNRALSKNEIKMLYYNRIGAVPSKAI